MEDVKAPVKVKNALDDAIKTVKAELHGFANENVQVLFVVGGKNSPTYQEVSLPMLANEILKGLK